MTHGGCGIELLGDRDKRYALGIEQFDQLGEVRQRSSQTVDLVDNDAINLPSSDVVQQSLQDRPVRSIRPSIRHRHSGTGSGSIRHGPDSLYMPKQRHIVQLANSPLGDCPIPVTARFTISSMWVTAWA